MASREHETSVQPWGTLEELLLACAVSKHGTERWETVAMDVRTRTSVAGISPESCRSRLSDLLRRFALQDDESACLVEKLTKIRVADLRRDLQERDTSIVSLESKVKRLKAESHQRETKTERDSGADTPRKRVKSKSDASDSNRSFNESNSTAEQKRDSARNRGKRRNAEKSKTKAQVKPEADREEEEEDEEKEEAKQSSEVQSSSAKRRRIGGGGEEESPAMASTKLPSGIKSEPFAKLLATVRSHRLGAVFQRRLPSQESQRYKNMIRQHMDLRTIEARLEKAVYSNHTRKFFRDLLLIFSNAVVFFPRGSDEHVAATELRSTVLKEITTVQNTDITKIKKLGSKSKPLTPLKPEEPKREAKNDVALPKTNKNKSSVLATCHNKSSATKAVSEAPNKKGVNGIKKEKDSKANGSRKVNGEKVVLKKKSQDEVKRSGSTERGFGENELSSHDAATKTKKKGAVSFLKRMKQNSPIKAEEDDTDDDDDAVSDKDNHNEDSDVATEAEEDRVEVERPEGDKKKAKKKGSPASKSPDFKTPARREEKRVTRYAAAKEESSRNGKRTVGRPPKRPEKPPANGKKSTSDAGKPKKRSRK